MTTIRAHVRNGQIVPDEPIDLPEGTEVDVVLRNGHESSADGKTFYERYRKYIGMADELPPGTDSSAIDDVVYGDPHNQRVEGA